ncbi:hypothetical protein [Desulfoprunum benzoelyticum]|nr:hypothetical protein [Desulfoprunum benzoelyticum]
MEQSPAFPPATLPQIQSRFADWRQTKHHPGRIPENLWAAAVMPSQEYSL